MSETEYVNNMAATQDYHGNNRAIRVNYDLGAPPEKVWSLIAVNVSS